MAVLSIRKYLNDYGTESTNPLLQVCELLLEGIARSALAYDREEYGEFRATLQRLSSTLETAQESDELLAAGEAVNYALETYNRGALRTQAAQTVELRCMIEMLSQTLVSLAEAGGQSVQTLQCIRNQVENARQLDDIRLLRARLGDSLKAISDEARKQRERNTELLRHAEDAAELASGHHETPDLDQISGLPSARRAEKEIAGRLGSGSRYYAAVFVVERVESINLRYGYVAGDQLLQAFGRHLISKLSPGDTVFRWRGPTFVVLIDRAAPVDAVRAELARFASIRQEHTMEVDGNPVKLPLGCAWTIVPLATCQVSSEVSHQIDAFVAERSS